MTSRAFSIIGLCALTGCLPVYEPLPQAPAPEGPGRASGQRASAEVLQVRPEQPADTASLFLDADDATLLLDRVAEEGPPEQSAKLHSCMKMKFDTLGRLLASRGVAMPALPVTMATSCTALMVGNRTVTAQSARFLYCDGRATLGLPQYSARLAESPVQTTASATKMHDLFLSAAAEVIANFPTQAACRVGAQQAALFDAQNRCDPLGLACLLGYPPGRDLIDLCSQIVTTAEATPAGTGSTAFDAITTGKRIAVAAMLAAAQMCE